VDGVAVLLAGVGAEAYAFRNACAVDGLPLEGGRLTEEGVLVCPWHNCAYDARNGRRVDEPEQPGLAVVPVAISGGALQVAVNVA
jgi:nitrite reductase/ring-hydroxylating ferredoxin subunit